MAKLILPSRPGLIARLPTIRLLQLQRGNFAAFHLLSLRRLNIRIITWYFDDEPRPLSTGRSRQHPIIFVGPPSYFCRLLTVVDLSSNVVFIIQLTYECCITPSFVSVSTLHTELQTLC